MLLATLSLLVVAADPTSASRKIVSEVDALAKASKLEKRELRQCDRETATITTETDAKGLVRRVLWEFGSEDSMHTATTTFDAEGHARHLKVKVGAVPSASVKAEFWFDAAGKVLKKQRSTGGEGFSGYANEPDDYLVKDAKSWLEKNACATE